MDKDALVREVHHCLDIGLSRQVLARVASIALDDYARRVPVHATATQGHFTDVQVPVDPERQRPVALTLTNPAASNPTHHNGKKRKIAHGDWDSDRTEAKGRESVPQVAGTGPGFEVGKVKRVKILDLIKNDDPQDSKTKQNEEAGAITPLHRTNDCGRPQALQTTPNLQRPNPRTACRSPSLCMLMYNHVKVKHPYWTREQVEKWASRIGQTQVSPQGLQASIAATGAPERSSPLSQTQQKALGPPHPSQPRQAEPPTPGDLNRVEQ
ncbi:hypothetical protein EJ07DRAFT_171437 [Lizonia empirigonia]|nr:hypothetical protein EJ07DRAFT_171437 [Lizonia empirigonia]